MEKSNFQAICNAIIYTTDNAETAVAPYAVPQVQQKQGQGYVMA